MTDTHTPDTVDIHDMTTTGASSRRVDNWTRLGYLHPVDRDHPTSGVPRRWPTTERDICARMVRLTNAGLSVPLSHTIARTPGIPGGLQLGDGVRIVIDPDPSTTPAAPAAPAVQAFGAALHQLLDQATAAADLIGEVNTGLPEQARIFVERTAPAPDTWPIDMLRTAADLLTGPDFSTDSDKTIPDEPKTLTESRA